MMGDVEIDKENWANGVKPVARKEAFYKAVRKATNKENRALWKDIRHYFTKITGGHHLTTEELNKIAGYENETKTKAQLIREDFNDLFESVDQSANVMHVLPKSALSGSANLSRSISSSENGSSLIEVSDIEERVFEGEQGGKIGATSVDIPEPFKDTEKDLMTFTYGEFNAGGDAGPKKEPFSSDGQEKPWLLRNYIKKSPQNYLISDAGRHLPGVLSPSQKQMLEEIQVLQKEKEAQLQDLVDLTDLISEAVSSGRATSTDAQADSTSNRSGGSTPTLVNFEPVDKEKNRQHSVVSFTDSEFNQVVADVDNYLGIKKEPENREVAEPLLVLAQDLPKADLVLDGPAPPPDLNSSGHKKKRRICSRFTKFFTSCSIL